MKVRPSVKPICEKCKIIRRKGKVMVICEIRSTSRSRAEKASPWAVCSRCFLWVYNFLHSTAPSARAF